MIHRRIDDNELNKDAKFECGIAWPLPEGDLYIFEAEYLSSHRVTCVGCGGGPPEQLGTPISELSGQPGHPGYEKFCDIARSWGYE